MGIQERLKKTAFNTVFSYLERDPEKNIMKVMDWVDALAGDGENSFPVQRAAFRQVLEDPDNNMHRLIMDILENVDRDVVKATFQNFFLNANIIGWPKQEEMRAQYNCNIPWAILLDPTSA